MTMFQDLIEICRNSEKECKYYIHTKQDKGRENINLKQQTFYSSSVLLSTCLFA